MPRHSIASTNHNDFLLFADSAEPAKRPHNPRYTTPAGYHVYVVWPLPFSLATTNGIAVAFSSCGYWDVSLPHVPSAYPIYSGMGDWTWLQPGFPIRKSSDQCSVDSSPRLIAASYVLHRLLVPRHPPCALINLPQRCSRPLCSSQGTGGDPADPSRTPRGAVRKDWMPNQVRPLRPWRPGKSPLPQDSTVCLRISTNERPRSTRQVGVLMADVRWSAN